MKFLDEPRIPIEIIVRVTYAVTSTKKSGRDSLTYFFKISYKIPTRIPLENSSKVLSEIFPSIFSAIPLRIPQEISARIRLKTS